MKQALPHDLDAERSVLGAMLINNAVIPTVLEALSPAAFYREAHRHVFSAIADLHRRADPADLVTVAAQLEHARLLDEVNVAYLARLIDGVPESTNVAAYAAIVRDKALLRMTASDAQRLANEAGGPGADLDAVRDRAARIIEAFSDSPVDRYERRVLHALESERIRRDARRRLALEEQLAAPVPEVLTLRQRLARPRTGVDYRIEGLLPRDARAMLTAQFKTGKTTMVSNLVRSLVDREPFLGRAAIASLQGNVGVIDTEMPARQLDEWYGDQGIVNDHRVVLFPLRGALSSFNILDPTARREWASRLRAHDVAVVILDCLRPVLDALGVNEHSETGRFLVPLDELLREAGVSEAVVVHHAGHGGERSRGDSRLRDWPDVEWTLVRQDDDPRSARFFRAFGRDVDLPESRLLYDAANRSLTLEGGSRRDARALAALDAVLEVVKGSPSPMSGRGIESALDESEHSRDTVRAAIRYGMTEGYLSAEKGQRGAMLYRVRECAAVRDECAARGASERAVSYIETAHSRTQNGRVIGTVRPAQSGKGGIRV